MRASLRRGSAVFAILLLAACGQRAPLEPPPGQPLPPTRFGSSVPSDADTLLAVDPQAVPERNVELRRRSEQREDDPFDLPPE